MTPAQNITLNISNNQITGLNVGGTVGSIQATVNSLQTAGADKLAEALKVFFFNNPPTTELYTLSLHDALPILLAVAAGTLAELVAHFLNFVLRSNKRVRSEEHTSELQSHVNLVCRLLLEKKKKTLSQINSRYWKRKSTIQTNSYNKG